MKAERIQLGHPTDAVSDKGSRVGQQEEQQGDKEIITWNWKPKRNSSVVLAVTVHTQGK